MDTLIKRPGLPFRIAGFDAAMPDGATPRLKKSTKKTKRSGAMAAVRNPEVPANQSDSRATKASMETLQEYFKHTSGCPKRT